MCQLYEGNKIEIKKRNDYWKYHNKYPYVLQFQKKKPVFFLSFVISGKNLAVATLPFEDFYFYWRTSLFMVS